jgi:hypothetical protein
MQARQIILVLGTVEVVIVALAVLVVILAGVCANLLIVLAEPIP